MGTFKLNYKSFRAGLSALVTILLVSSAAGHALAGDANNKSGPSGQGIQHHGSRALDKLAGVWVATSGNDRGEVITIQQTSGGVKVVSYVDSDGERFKILSSSSENGILTWSYLVPSTGYVLSFEVIDVYADFFKAAYHGDRSGRGTVDYKRK